MTEASSPTITVLTPAYNRADTLERLRDSLAAQTYRDFEWVIIDDGSADHIKSLVESWVASGELDINYRWQANQGKTAAVNRGIELARGRVHDDNR